MFNNYCITTLQNAVSRKCMLVHIIILVFNCGYIYLNFSSFNNATILIYLVTQKLFCAGTFEFMRNGKYFSQRILFIRGGAAYCHTVLQAVFYAIDRELPKFQRGQLIT